MCHAGPSSLVFFWGMLNSLRWWFKDCSVRRIKKTNVQSLYWSFGFTPSTCYWVHIRVLWSSLPLHWKPNIFYRSIMTADDSIKCRCANSGMTGQVGGFQNPGVCLQASFLPHPLPALLHAPFFAWSLTLVPRSLLPKLTEMLATQARLTT